MDTSSAPLSRSTAAEVTSLLCHKLLEPLAARAGFNCRLDLHWLESIPELQLSTDEFAGYVWLFALILVGLFNVYNWWHLRVPRASKILVGNYVFACLYRSIFMTDVTERLCFGSSFFNWPIMNRLVASIGEVSFGVMLNSHIFENNPWWRYGSLAVIANVFSYVAAITRNVYYSMVEEGIWLLFTVIALYCVYTQRGKQGFGVHFYLVLIWSVYLACVDIPMYYWQRQGHIANNYPTFSLLDGLLDSTTCWWVTQKFFTDWNGVWLWHTLYFITGPTALIMYSYRNQSGAAAGESHAKTTKNKTA